MRILFYIEPVTFRLNPLLLTPWLDWIGLIISPHISPETTFAFASSGPLCSAMRQKLGDIPCHFFDISPRVVLEPFQFDRHQYGRDLFGFSPSRNPALINQLAEIDKTFRPHVTISFTQNRYIEEIFAHRVLFWELGPLPRLTNTHSFFMDPLGHQVNGIPNKFGDRIRNLPLSDPQIHAIHEMWDRKVIGPIEHHHLFDQVKSWLSSIRADKRTALLALQPQDWLTYEAAWRQSAVDQMIMQCATEAPEEWILVPVLHPAQSFPASMRDVIEREFPNVRFPPQELWIGTSEIFLPNVDAVISISSSLSIQGVLHGKKSITLGQSQFSSFTAGSIEMIDQISVFDLAERARLLAFLSNRYSHPFHRCVSEKSYAIDVAKCLVGDPEAYFDISRWSPEHLDSFL